MAIYVPSFWDYLGQGIQAGREGFESARARTHEYEAQARQEAMQRFGVMQQLFNQGAIGSDELSSAGKAAGFDLNVQPNAPEMAHKIMNAKPVNVSVPVPGAVGATPAATEVSIPGSAQFSDDQRRFAGLPTSLDMRKEDILKRFSMGGPVSDQEAAFAGVVSPTQIDAQKRQLIDPQTSAAAARYVSGIANRLGLLTPTNAQQVADQAFQRWLGDREGSQLGALTPDETKYARSFFDAAVQDRLDYQAELAIKQAQADAAKTRANNVGSDDPTRWFRSITSRINSNTNRMNTLLRENSVLAFALQDPSGAAMNALSSMPQVAGALAEYNRLKQHNDMLTQAQATGIISPEIIQSLVAPPGGAGTAAPPPNAQGPAAGGPAPQNGITLGGVPSMTKQQIEQAVSFMRQVPSDQQGAYIDQQQAAGSITPADAKLLKKKLGIS